MRRFATEVTHAFVVVGFVVVVVRIRLVWLGREKNNEASAVDL